MKPPIKLCLVNRNYPPTYGATGYHAKRLVDYLETTGLFSIDIVTVGSSNVKNDNPRIKYVRSIYRGKKKWIRLLSTFLEGYFLIRKAKKHNAAFYIVMTDPSFLNFWGAKLLKSAKWALWTMDLYPEAFVANDLIANNHAAVNYYRKVLITSPPDYLITLGKCQLEYLISEYNLSIPSTAIPIGLLAKDTTHDNANDELPNWINVQKITFGYIGSLGEAHDTQKIIRLIEQLDYDRYDVVLSCSGSKAKYLYKNVESFSNVILVDHVSQNHLKYIDIQIVSLLSEWTHVCVPSKAITAVQHGSAVLFFGKEESDSWQYVTSAGWRITKDYTISTFLINLDKQSLLKKKQKAVEVASNLQLDLDFAFQDIANKIKQTI